MLNIYKYYDEPDTLPGIEQYKQKLISSGNINAMFTLIRDTIKVRWPEAEPIIMKDPHTAWWYALYVIKGRWPEAEPYIKTNAYLAYEYSSDILSKDKIWKKEPGHKNGRWPEAEPYIMKDMSSAFAYAKRVIKGRWPEYEQQIIKNPYVAYTYAKDVIKGRWPEAEPYIKKDQNEWKSYKKKFGVE